MPCYDSRDEPAYITKEFNEKIKLLEKRNDMLAKAACELANKLEEVAGPKVFLTLSMGTRGWVTAHRQFDKARKGKR